MVDKNDKDAENVHQEPKIDKLEIRGLRNVPFLGPKERDDDQHGRQGCVDSVAKMVQTEEKGPVGQQTYDGCLEKCSRQLTDVEMTHGHGEGESGLVPRQLSVGCPPLNLVLVQELGSHEDNPLVQVYWLNSEAPYL